MHPSQSLARPCRLLTLAVVACVALAAAPTANAAVTCLRAEDGETGIGTLFVTLGDGDSATIAASGGTITLDGAPCDTATTTNIDTIDISGTAGPQTLEVSQATGAIGPGQTTEATGLSEIEVVVSLDSWDTFSLIGTAGNDRLTAGNDGLAWNTDGDADLTFPGLPTRIWLYGRQGSDRLSGMGGYGTGAPYALTAAQVNINGEDGNDMLLPSRVPNEYVMGMAGVDTVSFAGRPAGVTVALGDLTFSDGAGADLDMVREDVENVVGTSFGDTISGSALANAIVGGGGNDYIVGRAGRDSLFGNAGRDVIIARDSDRDLVSGGAGYDRARVNRTDTVRSIEKRLR